jgi:hypothetical protein
VSGMPISEWTAEISFGILMLGWEFGRTDRTGVVVIFRSERARFFHAAKEIVRPVGSLVNPDMVSETFPAEVKASGPVGLVMPDRSIGTRMPCGTLVDVKVTGTIDALRGKSGDGESGRAQEVHMDITTILVIVLIVIVLGGGGFYGRGRWY